MSSSQPVPTRVADLLAEPHYLCYFELVQGKPPYDPINCPEGIVLLYKTENNLNEALVSKKLYECYPDSSEVSVLYYNKSHGCIRLREEMARFLTRYMRAPRTLDPKNLIMTTGLAGGLNYLAMATAEIGDYYLVPTPCYHRLGPDIGDCAGVKSLYVPLSENGQSLADTLSVAYTTSTKEGKNISGILISNPDNPTGRIYTKEEIMGVLEFCARFRLHVIVDEVYALTIHGSVPFHSVLSFQELPDPDRTHFVWSLSKDFGLSGYRMGVVYTTNQLILRYLQKLSILFQLPMLTQLVIENFLSDHEWLDNIYFPSNIRKLRERYSAVKRKLENMGVTVHTSSAGLYVWANFSKFLKEKTFAAEREFHQELIQAGVYLVSGENLRAHEPGWFRIVYALHDHHIDEGIKRLERFLATKRSVSKNKNTTCKCSPVASRCNCVTCKCSTVASRCNCVTCTCGRMTVNKSIA